MTGETKQLKDDVVHQAIKDAETNQPDEYNHDDNSNFINTSTKQQRGKKYLFISASTALEIMGQLYSKINLLFFHLASSPAEGLQLKVPNLRSRSSSPAGLEKTPIPWLNKCKYLM